MTHQKRLKEIPTKEEMETSQFSNLPPKLITAMRKDKKPFTYTPGVASENGKLDLNAIKSPRMKKRILANLNDDTDTTARAEDGTSHTLQQSPPPKQQHRPPPPPPTIPKQQPILFVPFVQQLQSVISNRETKRDATIGQQKTTTDNISNNNGNSNSNNNKQNSIVEHLFDDSFKQEIDNFERISRECSAFETDF